MRIKVIKQLKSNKSLYCHFITTREAVGVSYYTCGAWILQHFSISEILNAIFSNIRRVLKGDKFVCIVGCQIQRVYRATRDRIQLKPGCEIYAFRPHRHTKAHPRLNPKLFLRRRLILDKRQGLFLVLPHKNGFLSPAIRYSQSRYNLADTLFPPSKKWDDICDEELHRKTIALSLHA